MSNNLDTTATRRILAAIIEVAYHDCGSSRADVRKEALGFFFSPVFESICLGLELNDRRIRVKAGKLFTKAEELAKKKSHGKQNTRTGPRKKRKGKQTANKELGEVSGELRSDLQEPSTHPL